jgi:hypothetical protein
VRYRYNKSVGETTRRMTTRRTTRDKGSFIDKKETKKSDLEWTPRRGKLLER